MIRPASRVSVDVLIALGWYVPIRVVRNPEWSSMAAEEIIAEIRRLLDELPSPVRRAKEAADEALDLAGFPSLDLIRRAR